MTCFDLIGPWLKKAEFNHCSRIHKLSIGDPVQCNNFLNICKTLEYTLVHLGYPQVLISNGRTIYKRGF